MDIPLVVLSDWIALISFGIGGVLLCGWTAYARSSVGMAVLALYFAMLSHRHGYAIWRQVEMLRDFEPVQTGPQTWTAPVLQFDRGDTIATAMLLVAAWLLSRQLGRIASKGPPSSAPPSPSPS